MKAILVFFAACVLSLSATAKLPAPDEAAKAKAAEAKAKQAHAAKVGAYATCKAQDKAVAHYRRKAKKAMAAVATPPCVNPGKM